MASKTTLRTDPAKRRPAKESFCEFDIFETYARNGRRKNDASNLTEKINEFSARNAKIEEIYGNKRIASSSSTSAVSKSSSREKNSDKAGRNRRKHLSLEPRKTAQPEETQHSNDCNAEQRRHADSRSSNTEENNKETKCCRNSEERKLYNFFNTEETRQFCAKERQRINELSTEHRKHFRPYYSEERKDFKNSNREEKKHFRAFNSEERKQFKHINSEDKELITKERDLNPEYRKHSRYLNPEIRKQFRDINHEERKRLEGLNTEERSQFRDVSSGERKFNTEEQKDFYLDERKHTKDIKSQRRKHHQKDQTSEIKEVTLEEKHDVTIRQKLSELHVNPNEDKKVITVYKNANVHLGTDFSESLNSKDFAQFQSEKTHARKSVKEYEEYLRNVVVSNKHAILKVRSGYKVDCKQLDEISSAKFAQNRFLADEQKTVNECRVYRKNPDGTIERVVDNYREKSQNNPLQNLFKPEKVAHRNRKDLTDNSKEESSKVLEDAESKRERKDKHARRNSLEERDEVKRNEGKERRRNKSTPSKDERDFGEMLNHRIEAYFGENNGDRVQKLRTKGNEERTCKEESSCDRNVAMKHDYHKERKREDFSTNEEHSSRKDVEHCANEDCLVKNKESKRCDLNQLEKELKKKERKRRELIKVEEKMKSKDQTCNDFNELERLIRTKIEEDQRKESRKQRKKKKHQDENNEQEDVNKTNATCETNEQEDESKGNKYTKADFAKFEKQLRKRDREEKKELEKQRKHDEAKSKKKSSKSSKDTEKVGIFGKRKKCEAEKKTSDENLNDPTKLEGKRKKRDGSKEEKISEKCSNPGLGVADRKVKTKREESVFKVEGTDFKWMKGDEKTRLSKEVEENIRKSIKEVEEKKKRNKSRDNKDAESKHDKKGNKKEALVESENQHGAKTKERDEVHRKECKDERRRRKSKEFAEGKRHKSKTRNKEGTLNLIEEGAECKNTNNYKLESSINKLDDYSETGKKDEYYTTGYHEENHGKCKYGSTDEKDECSALTNTDEDKSITKPDVTIDQNRHDTKAENNRKSKWRNIEELENGIKTIDILEKRKMIEMEIEKRIASDREKLQHLNDRNKQLKFLKQNLESYERRIPINQTTSDETLTVSNEHVTSSTLTSCASERLKPPTSATTETSRSSRRKKIVEVTAEDSLRKLLEFYSTEQHDRGIYNRREFRTTINVLRSPKGRSVHRKELSYTNLNLRLGLCRSWAEVKGASKTALALRDICKVAELEQVRMRFSRRRRSSFLMSPKKGISQNSKFRKCKLPAANERIVEISSKMSKDEEVKFTVEGIEPVKKLLPYEPNPAELKIQKFLQRITTEDNKSYEDMDFPNKIRCELTVDRLKRKSVTLRIHTFTGIDMNLSDVRLLNHGVYRNEKASRCLINFEAPSVRALPLVGKKSNVFSPLGKKSMNLLGLKKEMKKKSRKLEVYNNKALFVTAQASLLRSSVIDSTTQTCAKKTLFEQMRKDFAHIKDEFVFKKTGLHIDRTESGEVHANVDKQNDEPKQVIRHEDQKVPKRQKSQSKIPKPSNVSSSSFQNESKIDHTKHNEVSNDGIPKSPRGNCDNKQEIRRELIQKRNDNQNDAMKNLLGNKIRRNDYKNDVFESNLMQRNKQATLFDQNKWTSATANTKYSKRKDAGSKSFANNRRSVLEISCSSDEITLRDRSSSETNHIYRKHNKRTVSEHSNMNPSAGRVKDDKNWKCMRRRSSSSAEMVLRSREKPLEMLEYARRREMEISRERFLPKRSQSTHFRATTKRPAVREVSSSALEDMRRAAENETRTIIERRKVETDKEKQIRSKESSPQRASKIPIHVSFNRSKSVCVSEKRKPVEAMLRKASKSEEFVKDSQARISRSSVHAKNMKTEASMDSSKRFSRKEMDGGIFNGFVNGGDSSGFSDEKKLRQNHFPTAYTKQNQERRGSLSPTRTSTTASKTERPRNVSESRRYEVDNKQKLTSRLKRSDGRKQPAVEEKKRSTQRAEDVKNKREDASRSAKKTVNSTFRAVPNKTSMRQESRRVEEVRRNSPRRTTAERNSSLESKHVEEDIRKCNVKRNAIADDKLAKQESRRDQDVLKIHKPNNKTQETKRNTHSGLRNKEHECVVKDTSKYKQNRIPISRREQEKCKSSSSSEFSKNADSAGDNAKIKCIDKNDVQISDQKDLNPNIKGSFSCHRDEIKALEKCLNDILLKLSKDDDKTCEQTPQNEAKNNPRKHARKTTSQELLSGSEVVLRVQDLVAASMNSTLKASAVEIFEDPSNSTLEKCLLQRKEESKALKNNNPAPAEEVKAVVGRKTNASSLYTRKRFNKASFIANKKLQSAKLEGAVTSPRVKVRKNKTRESSVKLSKTKRSLGRIANNKLIRAKMTHSRNASKMQKMVSSDVFSFSSIETEERNIWYRSSESMEKFKEEMKMKQLVMKYKNAKHACVDASESDIVAKNIWTQNAPAIFAAKEKLPYNNARREGTQLLNKEDSSLNTSTEGIEEDSIETLNVNKGSSVVEIFRKNKNVNRQAMVYSVPATYQHDKRIKYIFGKPILCDENIATNVTKTKREKRLKKEASARAQRNKRKLRISEMIRRSYARSPSTEYAIEEDTLSEESSDERNAREKRRFNSKEDISVAADFRTKQVFTSREEIPMFNNQSRRVSPREERNIIKNMLLRDELFQDKQTYTSNEEFASSRENLSFGGRIKQKLFARKKSRDEMKSPGKGNDNEYVFKLGGLKMLKRVRSKSDEITRMADAEKNIELQRKGTLEEMKSFIRNTFADELKHSGGGKRNDAANRRNELFRMEVGRECTPRGGSPDGIRYPREETKEYPRVRCTERTQSPGKIKKKLHIKRKVTVKRRYTAEEIKHIGIEHELRILRAMDKMKKQFLAAARRHSPHEINQSTKGRGRSPVNVHCADETTDFTGEIVRNHSPQWCRNCSDANSSVRTERNNFNVGNEQEMFHVMEKSLMRNNLQRPNAKLKPKRKLAEIVRKPSTENAISAKRKLCEDATFKAKLKNEDRLRNEHQKQSLINMKNAMRKGNISAQSLILSHGTSKSLSDPSVYKHQAGFSTNKDNCVISKDPFFINHEQGDACIDSLEKFVFDANVGPLTAVFNFSPPTCAYHVYNTFTFYKKKADRAKKGEGGDAVEENRTEGNNEAAGSESSKVTKQESSPSETLNETTQAVIGSGLAKETCSNAFDTTLLQQKPEECKDNTTTNDLVNQSNITNSIAKTQILNDNAKPEINDNSVRTCETSNAQISNSFDQNFQENLPSTSGNNSKATKTFQNISIEEPRVKRTSSESMDALNIWKYNSQYEENPNGTEDVQQLSSFNKNLAQNPNETPTTINEGTSKDCEELDTTTNEVSKSAKGTSKACEELNTTSNEDKTLQNTSEASTTKSNATISCSLEDIFENELVDPTSEMMIVDPRNETLVDFIDSRVEDPGFEDEAYASSNGTESCCLSFETIPKKCTATLQTYAKHVSSVGKLKTRISFTSRHLLSDKQSAEVLVLAKHEAARGEIREKREALVFEAIPPVRRSVVEKVSAAEEVVVGKCTGAERNHSFKAALVKKIKTCKKHEPKTQTEVAGVQLLQSSQEAESEECSEKTKGKKLKKKRTKDKTSANVSRESTPREETQPTIDVDIEAPERENAHAFETHEVEKKLACSSPLTERKWYKELLLQQAQQEQTAERYSNERLRRNSCETPNESPRSKDNSTEGFALQNLSRGFTTWNSFSSETPAVSINWVTKTHTSPANEASANTSGYHTKGSSICSSTDTNYAMKSKPCEGFNNERGRNYQACSSIEEENDGNATNWCDIVRRKRHSSFTEERRSLSSSIDEAFEAHFGHSRSSSVGGNDKRVQCCSIEEGLHDKRAFSTSSSVEEALNGKLGNGCSSIEEDAKVRKRYSVSSSIDEAMDTCDYLYKRSPMYSSVEDALNTKGFSSNSRAFASVEEEVSPSVKETLNAKVFSAGEERFNPKISSVEGAFYDKAVGKAMHENISSSVEEALNAKASSPVHRRGLSTSEEERTPNYFAYRVQGVSPKVFTTWAQQSPRESNGSSTDLKALRPKYTKSPTLLTSKFLRKKKHRMMRLAEASNAESQNVKFNYSTKTGTSKGCAVASSDGETPSACDLSSGSTKDVFVAYESGYESSKPHGTNSIRNFFKKGGTLLEVFKKSRKIKGRFDEEDERDVDGPSNLENYEVAAKGESSYDSGAMEYSDMETYKNATNKLSEDSECECRIKLDIYTTTARNSTANINRFTDPEDPNIQKRTRPKEKRKSRLLEGSPQDCLKAVENAESAVSMSGCLLKQFLNKRGNSCESEKKAPALQHLRKNKEGGKLKPCTCEVRKTGERDLLLRSDVHRRADALHERLAQAERKGRFMPQGPIKAMQEKKIEALRNELELVLKKQRLKDTMEYETNTKPMYAKVAEEKVEETKKRFFFKKKPPVVEGRSKHRLCKCGIKPKIEEEELEQLTIHLDDDDITMPTLGHKVPSLLSIGSAPSMASDDSAVSIKSHSSIIKAKLTDKEVFDKLLTNFERKSSIAERLSRNDEFFHKTLIPAVSKSAIPDDEDEDSTANINKSTSPRREKYRDPKFTDKGPKKIDCSVNAEDIGTCFARGFRPDNMMLSGDACFNLNKQDKRKMNPYMLKNTESIIDFSERETPLDFLLALGFMVDEASNALKDDDIRSRLLAAITEARVWINRITTTQGTLLYLVAFKARPETMRYFLQLVEAIINKRINNAIKLDGFLRVLEQVEDGTIQMINILGEDRFEDAENEEKAMRRQLKRLFIDVYVIAESEATNLKKELKLDQVNLLRILVSKYRAGLVPHLELIARYIGQGLLDSHVQLEAAMIFLSRLDNADVKLKEFENYCGIHCQKEKKKMDLSTVLGSYKI